MLVALLESAPVAMYRTDAAGNVVYTNPEYRRIFGLDPEQSVDDWAQGVHPEDRARMEQEWAAFCANPRPMTCDYRTVDRAGRVRHLTERVVPIEGMPAFVGTISDVTALVSARSDLRRVEVLFRNTVEEAPIGIAYADRAGRFQRCNRSFAALLGVEPEELETRTTLELTHREDAAAASSAFDRLWRREVPSVELEKRYLRSDGSAVWVHSTQSLVPQSEGASECLVEFTLDISTRKRLTAELEEHKALFETLLANLPLALIACDAEGRVTHYNREAAALCSMEQREFQTDGYSVRAGIYQTDGVTPVERADRPLARTLRGEQVENLELVIIPQDATERVTVSNGRRLIGPDGRLMGALCVSQDITERRRSELELERLHEQLRTSARQAGMAEVATSILHNVGNVLTSINVCSGLLTDELKRSKVRDVGRVGSLLKEQGARLGQFVTDDERGKVVPAYLQALGERLVQENEAALGHMAALRKSLEHVNHVVAMQQNYAKLGSVNETVSVVDLIEDSLRLSAGAFIRHGIELCREFEPTPPITVDKHKVLQILVNLLRNAKHACDESGKKDRVLRLQVAGDGERVRISVIDNGVGISPENMNRLFTHGFTTRASGHGFGLHSAVIAAQQLGGTLRAESAGLGHGATFILELPRDPPRADS
jgi:PAS domain S-box-containing protein